MVLERSSSPPHSTQALWRDRGPGAPAGLFRRPRCLRYTGRPYGHDYSSSFCRRLSASVRPVTEGRKTARALSEIFVTDIDDCLREMGVGDLSVPKKVKARRAGAWASAAKPTAPPSTSPDARRQPSGSRKSPRPCPASADKSGIRCGARALRALNARSRCCSTVGSRTFQRARLPFSAPCKPLEQQP